MQIRFRRLSCLLLFQVIIFLAVQPLCAYQEEGIHQKNTQDLLPCTPGIREFRYDPLRRLVGGSGFSRVLDAFGNILREDFANGLWIESEYDTSDRPIERRLPDGSRIHYEYQGPFLKKVIRLNKDGSVIYSHSYEDYDQRSNPGREVGYFISLYKYDKMGRRINQHNPYYQETIEYDAVGNIIRKGDIFYTYDVLSQMTSESEHFTAKYDHRYNLQEINGAKIQTDSLNQIEGLSYDLNGNLLKPGFVYDCFDQLIEAEEEAYVYDGLGRRISKGNVSYLYTGEEEIASFENGECKELKVLGLHDPIAIEIEGKPFFSVCDVQGTICLLIDPENPKTPILNHCDAFGANVNWMIPYAYVGKRYDPETGFYYFGKRYYDPMLRRWATPDPLGPIDHSNLYQYVFNNPYRYFDPTGESLGGYLLGLGEILLGGTLILTGGVLEVATFGGYTIGCGFQVGAGMALIGDGLTRTTIESRDLSFGPNGRSEYNFDSLYKSGSVDPSLPANPDDLLKRPGWKETTHPEAGKKGHRTFENKETGEKLRHDKGKSWGTGHKAHDHYHRPNPNATGKHDEYLDGRGNPTRDQSDPSHIYSPEGVWWN